MPIANETIDRIRLSVDIAEIVRSYIPTLKRSGRNWKANCPFHNEKTPSFMVSPDKGIFHCFGCNAGGDVFKFVMMMDNLTWPEAVRKLGGIAGIEIKETREDTVKRSQRQEIFDILEQAASFYHRALLEHSEASRARAYLKKRGLTEETVRKFKIGYSPENTLIPAAVKKNITQEQLVSSGLVTKTERGRFFEYMSGRIVFPIIDIQGRVVAFGGRTLGSDEPKYINTPETAVYSKSQQLYGLYQASGTLRTGKKAIVLEGYMDVVTTHQCGMDSTVATLGTALTVQQVSVLKRYVDDVVVLFDSDKAGVNAAKRAVDTLIEAELPSRVACLPEGIDPDEFILKEGKSEFERWLLSGSKDTLDFLVSEAVKTHGKASPEAKIKVIEDVMPFIEKTKNAVLKAEWIKNLASSIGVSEESVLIELRRRKKGFAQRKQEASGGRNTKGPVIRSAEEEILQLVSAFPEFAASVKPEIFSGEKNRKVFELLRQGTAAADMIKQFDEEDIGWLTELMLEEKSYQSPRQTLEALAKDIRKKELEMQRQKLEGEVNRMLVGQIPVDSNKIELYNSITKQLKGSAG